ncbi:MAG: RNA polymerase sigma factor [Clostridia bacterium]|nr:RNA polymerase sigma factor [Clostridia bacterium]
MIVVFALNVDDVQNKNARIEQLLLDVSNGDATSMGSLYDLIKTDVFAFAISKLANKQEADDVMQDTFIQIYKYAKQYQPQGKPLAWIFRIELNLIRRLFQLKTRNVQLDEGIENTLSSQNMEDKIINSAFLNETLKILNEEEREVVTLRIVSGMKNNEIAKLLEKPLSTVLSKYNRAIKKMKLIVKERY